MDSTFEPWIAYPPLTEDRLSAIATILRDVRERTVSKHEAEDGDSEWSLDWLTILPELEKLRFSFAIGSIPFRFYKGTADDPPGKYIETTFGELRQQQLSLEIDGVSLRNVVLRLAIETNAARLASRVILVEMNESGTITNTYEIPFDAEGSNVVPLVVPPVSLPPVGLPTTEEAEQEARNRDVSSQ
jgi:hypothetical protein